MLSSDSRPKRRQIDPAKRQFGVTSAHVSGPASSGIEYAGQAYPIPLSLYSRPPTGEIALEQFEEWAIARLKVLNELESCIHRLPAQSLAGHLGPVLEKLMPLHPTSSRSSGLAVQRARDHYSHFILRLAFAGTDELRKRFVRLETALFKHRWRDADAKDKAGFLRFEQFGWDRVSDQDAAALRPELLAATGQPTTASDDASAAGWFRVPWQSVPDLVENRRVLIRDGFAFVSARDISALVVPEFSKRLERAMEDTAKALPQLDESDRLEPILRHLAHGVTGGGIGTFDESADGLAALLAGAGGKLRQVHPTAANVPHLSSSGYFPPCMSQIQRRLTDVGHTKHAARFEYTLFLKAVGLTVDECVAFWRASLRTKSADEFKKEYEYNIRHAYGTLGNNAEVRRAGGYSAYGCNSLIKAASGSGAAGDVSCHGCPLRSYAPANLRSMLEREMNLSVNVVREVERDVNAHRYTVGCNRIFEAVHSEQLNGLAIPDGNLAEALRPRLGDQEAARFVEQISHPNEYFRRSFVLRHWDALVGSGS